MLHKITTLKVDDGEPTDIKERREYVGRVAGFFSDILNKKLDAMIVQQHQALANPLNSREEDISIKANINALSLIYDWGDACLLEHLDNGKNNPETET